ncbi:MMPL family transporter [Longispora albida]|uniref:MMPL family transporter n=1 Tax=Longispora albida TaxID=203523 RepID=UPI000371D9FF|nr:MMPL family transporter [Longispora albida]
MSAGLGYKFRYVVLAIWAVVAVLGGVLGGGVFDRLGETPTLSPRAESKQAGDRLHQLVPDGPVMIAVVKGRDVYDKALVDQVSGIVEQVRKLGPVAKVDDLYSSPGGQVSGDKLAMTIRVKLVDGLSEDERHGAEDQVKTLLHQISAPEVLVGGKELTERAFQEQAMSDLAIGEGVAFALLLVALFVIFGSVLGASIPLAVAVVSILVSLLALRLLAGVAPVSEYTVNIVTLLGLGLAVDYSLLIVARFREDGRSARRTIVISGLTVAASLLGLLFFDEPLLVSMALGGCVVVLVSAAVAVTLVPAILAVAGHRLKPAKVSDRLLPKLAGFAQRNAGQVTLWTVLGLALLSVPFLGVDLQNSDARALPASQEARRSYDAYQKMTGSAARPLDVIVEADDATPQVRDYMNKLLRLPGAHRLALDSDAPEGTTIIQLTPKGETTGAQARDLVTAVREVPTPFLVRVGGEAAEVVDYRSSVAKRLPIAVLAVLLATFALLFWLTRSLVVPLKALVFNLLTAGASFGLLSLLFGTLDLTTPVLLFVFVFGLSTDYEVFLLARITEARRNGLSDDRAVLDGITRTGRVVTAAAVCICLVFAGFAAGQLIAVRELGVGMLLAVLIDVTIVRGLLLPASMTVLGRWNWWPSTTRASSTLEGSR